MAKQNLFNAKTVNKLELKVSLGNLPNISQNYKVKGNNGAEGETVLHYDTLVVTA